MAKLEMQKIEIAALQTDCKRIIERLQRRGVVELESCSDKRLVRLNTASSIAGFEKSLTAAREALEYLESVSEKRGGIADMLNGRKEISTADFAALKENAAKTMQICYDVNSAKKKINGLYGEISKAEIKIDTLKPWLSLDIPQSFGGTKCTSCFIGTFDREVSKSDIEIYVSKFDVYCEIVYAGKQQTGCAVICHKNNAVNVLRDLKENGFAAVGDASSLSPKNQTEKLTLQIADCKAEIENLKDSVKAYGKNHADIEFLIDYLVMRKDKYEAINKLGMSQSTVIICGFIPKRYVGGLIKEFESKYTVAINITDPGVDEDVPVLLKNGKFSEPVEGITEMYALPSRRDVDPNPVMAFFYYLFFGMMLSDAGYGLIMTVVTSIVLKKTRVEGTLRRSLTMFRNCGVSTLFWGALFGSWFGDLPQTIASQFFGTTIKTTALWFEPLNDPIKLLLFSFLLGIIHLFIGLGVNFKMLWSEGKRIDAVCDVIPIYITILGVMPIGASVLSDVPPSFVTFGKYAALVGAVLIVLTSSRSSKNIFVRFFGGIYGLYNVATGYLSDILSYSRLLALGLATGSIASVINLIGTMPQNTVLKAVMLIVVGLIGHTANMGINLLGAYVHSDRLQFVELFSKFYKGGGRAFKPLKANTKYYKLKKENIYE